MKLRVMVDNGIISHSGFAEDVVVERVIRWGDSNFVSRVHQLKRKASYSGDNPKQKEYEKQKEALFTVGRLIREGTVEAFTYSELNFERARARTANSMFNALQHCSLKRCSPAVERSRFRTTTNFKDAMAKGGRKDREAGVPLEDANQIAFFQWLVTLTKKETQAIMAVAAQIRLTQFDIEGLMDLDRFQSLCKRFPNPEDLPDLFHLWTAERNGLDAFLTLERILPAKIAQAMKEKRDPLKLRIKLLRPLDLLANLGIVEADPVPMEHGCLYLAF